MGKNRDHLNRAGYIICAFAGANVAVIGYAETKFLARLAIYAGRKDGTISGTVAVVNPRTKKYKVYTA